MAIFMTGDTHGDFSRLRPAAFYEQVQLTKADYLVIWRLRRHLGWQQYRTAMAGLVGKQAVHDAVCEWESRKFRPALQLPDQSVARRTRTGDSPQRPAPDAGTAL